MNFKSLEVKLSACLRVLICQTRQAQQHQALEALEFPTREVANSKTLDVWRFKRMKLPEQQAGPRAQGPYSVSVWGGKGGIGKSTDAFLAAYQLALIGPTLLINADKKQDGGGVTELVSSLKGLPVPFELTETDTAADLAAIRRLKQFRYVVTDHAPYRDEAKLKQAAKADLTIVPDPPRRLDSRAVMSSTKAYLAGTNYRLHITMVKHTDKSRARAMKTSLQDLGLPVFGGWMRYYNAHEMLNGLTVFEAAAEDAQAAKAAEDAYLFGDEILAQLGESFTVPRLGVK
ncbi:hypothetical protein ACFTWH_28035 [Streptomyces sp. NPDC057011]|uniref:hypothetical protein n=1 Tax=unclassified Streptomyces TaxID=2593676 RepID=UPI00363A4366